MIIHANHRWSAVNAHLWPYAIRMAADTMNHTLSAKHRFKATAAQVFTRSRVDVNPKDWMPIFCPVYVLKPELQSNSPHGKWKERARTGIYLGRSPCHARSVALVLNIETGRVSPQFHIKFDPTFSSVRPSSGNRAIEPLWMAQCGFERRKASHPMIAEDSEGNLAKEEFIGASDTAPEGDQQSPPDDAAEEKTVTFQEEEGDAQY